MPKSMNVKSYILVANREQKFLETVCPLLGDAGYSVLTAATLSQALDLLSGNTVALMICETGLKDSDGFELLKAVKSSPHTQKIPFIFFESLRDRESSGKISDAEQNNLTADALEEQISTVLKAFEMGAADFIVDTPVEEASKVLLDRIGKILPSAADAERAPEPAGKMQAASLDDQLENERVPESAGKPPVKSSDSQPGAVLPSRRERRNYERIYLNQTMGIEMSRDGVLWMPGQIVNIHEQGLMAETSLLGKLEMLLYVRVPLPDGKRVMESHIKHISIGKHQLSAHIGVKIEASPDWTDVYHFVVSQNDAAAPPPVQEASGADTAAAEKKFDANMVMQTEDGKREPVNDSRREKELEIKFYSSLVGKQLGNYKAVSFIGAGPMAGVFRGWDVVLERDVALKVISFNLSAIASYRDMFIREARLVSRLIHPHIAQIYHIDHMDDVFYFAMELIGGRTLAEMIRDKENFSTVKGLEHFITVCQTLDFVSRQNIVHGDISPENIMIDDQGILKVVDFGVAVVNGETDKKGVSEGLAGSPLYASPDIIKGWQPDSRSDIYSLGATFYHVFTGTPPFDGDSAETILSKHLNEDLIPIRKKNPVLSSQLSDIIGKMMAKNPEDRYQNYQDIISDLNQMLG